MTDKTLLYSLFDGRPHLWPAHGSLADLLPVSSSYQRLIIFMVNTKRCPVILWENPGKISLPGKVAGL
jgi:hypothetical protein